MFPYFILKGIFCHAMIFENFIIYLSTSDEFLYFDLLITVRFVLFKLLLQDTIDNQEFIIALFFYSTISRSLFYVILLIHIALCILYAI